MGSPPLRSASEFRRTIQEDWLRELFRDVASESECVVDVLRLSHATPLTECPPTLIHLALWESGGLIPEPHVFPRAQKDAPLALRFRGPTHVPNRSAI